MDKVVLMTLAIGFVIVFAIDEIRRQAEDREKDIEVYEADEDDEDDTDNGNEA